MSPIFEYWVDKAPSHLASACLHIGMGGWPEAEFEPESFTTVDHSGPMHLATARTPRGAGFACFEDFCLANADLLVPS